MLVLSFGVNRLSKTAAQALFWAFCACMGASLSNLLPLHRRRRSARTFFITAAHVRRVSLYGYTTKADLTKMGSFMMMGLIGIIIAGLVNMFMQSSALQFAISLIGVVVFVGLTAYDTQRIKADYVEYAYAEGTDEAGKRSVMDALGLYLNFINLFQLLLQLVGVRPEQRLSQRPSGFRQRPRGVTPGAFSCARPDLAAARLTPGRHPQRSDLTCRPMDRPRHVRPLRPSALHRRDRRAEGPRRRGWLEQPRPRPRGAGLYRGQPLAEPRRVLPGPRRPSPASCAANGRGSWTTG